MNQSSLTIVTNGRGLINITHEVAKIVTNSSINTGLCNVFLHHTSASLIFCENDDPVVLEDLEAFFKRLIPDDDTIFKHTLEGKDDMPAHVRMVLTQNSLMVPLQQNKLMLGRWQGIYLWEHRFKGHERRLTVTVL